jgi:hypothetical protein
MLQLGEEKAADIKALMDSMTLPQIAILTQLLIFAAENDYSVVEEMYMHSANRWNALTPQERTRAAEEGEDRFFSKAALEYYRTQDEIARKLGEEEGLNDPEGGLIVKPS